MARSAELLDMLCAHYFVPPGRAYSLVTTEICLIEPVFAFAPLLEDSLREITEQPLKARFMAKLEAGQAYSQLALFQR